MSLSVVVSLAEEPAPIHLPELVPRELDPASPLAAAARIFDLASLPEVSPSALSRSTVAAGGGGLLLPSSTLFFPAPPAVTEHMFEEATNNATTPNAHSLAVQSARRPTPSPRAGGRAATTPTHQAGTPTHKALTPRAGKGKVADEKENSLLVPTAAVTPRSDDSSTIRRVHSTGVLGESTSLVPAAPVSSRVGFSSSARRMSIHSSFGPPGLHQEYDEAVLRQTSRVAGCGNLNRALITRVTVDELMSSLRENLPWDRSWDQLTDMTAMEPTRSIGFVTPGTFQRAHARARAGTAAGTRGLTSAGGTRTPSAPSGSGGVTLLAPPANARHTGLTSVLEAPTRAVHDTEPEWRKRLERACGLILYVPQRHLMDDGAHVIRAALESNPRITKVDARANGFTPSACAQIMAALPASGVASLDLSAVHGFPMNHLGEIGAHALKQAFQARSADGEAACRLRALRLQHVGSVGVLHLVHLQVFEFGASLRVLDLTGNNLGQSTANGLVPDDVGATAGDQEGAATSLGAAPLRGVINQPHSSLHSATQTAHSSLGNVSSSAATTFLTDISAAAEEDPFNLNLPPLDSRHGVMGVNAPPPADSLMIRLCKSLAVSRVEKLVLARNHLHERDGNGAALIGLLAHPRASVTSLDLAHNHYGRAFGALLGSMFHKDAHALTQLILDHNPAMHDGAASAICSGLTANSTLKYLSMRDCGLTRTTAPTSPWAQRQPGEEVDDDEEAADTTAPINLMGPGDDSSTSWIEMLRANQVLLRLDLGENRIRTREVARLFRFGVAHNAALQTLELARMKLADTPFNPKKKGTPSGPSSTAIGASSSSAGAIPARPSRVPPEQNESSLISSLVYALCFNSALTGASPALAYLDLRHNELDDGFARVLYRRVVHRNAAHSSLLSVRLAFNRVDEGLVRLLGESMRANARQHRARMLASATKTWTEIRGCEMSLEKTNTKILEALSCEATLEARIAADEETFREVRARELESTNRLARELAEATIARERALSDMSFELARMESTHARRSQEATDASARVRGETAREKKKQKLLATHQTEVDEVCASLANVQTAGIKELAELEAELEEETRQLATLKREACVASFRLFMTTGRLLRAAQFCLILYCEQPRALRVSRRTRTVHLQAYARSQGRSYAEVQKTLSLIASRAPAFYETNVCKYFDADLDDFFQWFYDAFACVLDQAKRLTLHAWAWNLLEHYLRVPVAGGPHTSLAVAKLSILQPSQQPLLAAAGLLTPSVAHSATGSTEVVPLPVVLPDGTPSSPPLEHDYYSYRHFLNLHLSFASVHAALGRAHPLHQMVGGITLLGVVRPTKEALQRERERERSEKEAVAAAAAASHPSSRAHSRGHGAKTPHSRPTVSVAHDTSSPAATPVGDGHDTLAPTTATATATIDPLTLEFANESRLVSSFDIPFGSTLLLLLREEARDLVQVRQRATHSELGVRIAAQPAGNLSGARGSTLSTPSSRASRRTGFTWPQNATPRSAHTPASHSNGAGASAASGTSGDTLAPSASTSEVAASNEASSSSLVESTLDDVDAPLETTASPPPKSSRRVTMQTPLTAMAGEEASSTAPVAEGDAGNAPPAFTGFYGAHLRKAATSSAKSTDQSPSPTTTAPSGSRTERAGRGGARANAAPAGSLSARRADGRGGVGASAPVSGISPRTGRRRRVGGGAAGGFGSSSVRRTAFAFAHGAPASSAFLGDTAGSGGDSDDGGDGTGIIRLGGGLVRTVEEDDTIRTEVRARVEAMARRARKRQQGGPGGAPAPSQIFSSVCNQNNVTGGVFGAPSARDTAFPHLAFHALEWHEVGIALWWTVGELRRHLCQLFNIPERLVLDLQYVPGLPTQGLDPAALTTQAIEAAKNTPRTKGAANDAASSDSDDDSPVSSPRTGGGGSNSSSRLFLSPGQSSASALPSLDGLTPRSDANATTDSKPSPRRRRASTMTGRRQPSVSVGSGAESVSPTREAAGDGSTTVAVADNDPLSHFRVAAAPSPKHAAYVPHLAPLVLGAAARTAAAESAAAAQAAAQSSLGLDVDVSRIMSSRGLEDLLQAALVEAARLERARLKKHRKAMAAAEREKQGGFYANVARDGGDDTSPPPTTRTRHSVRGAPRGSISEGDDDGPGRVRGTRRDSIRAPANHGRRPSLIQRSGAIPSIEEGTSRRRSRKSLSVAPRSSSRADDDFSFGAKAAGPTSSTSGSAATTTARPASSNLSLSEILRATGDIAREVRDAKSATKHVVPTSQVASAGVPSLGTLREEDEAEGGHTIPSPGSSGAPSAAGGATHATLVSEVIARTFVPPSHEDLDFREDLEAVAAEQARRTQLERDRRDAAAAEAARAKAAAGEDDQEEDDDDESDLASLPSPPTVASLSGSRWRPSAATQRLDLSTLAAKLARWGSGLARTRTTRTQHTNTNKTN